MIASALTLNGALFYYDYSGFQEGYQFPDPLHPAYGGVGVAVTIPAKFYGAELESAYKFSPYDKLTLAPAILHARFTGNANPIDPYTGISAGTLGTDGGSIPNAPTFSASGGYEHSFPLPNGAQLIWGTDAHYKSEALTDYDPSNYPSTNPIFQQKAYAIYNSSLTYSSDSGKFSISAYGKNLGNTIYKVTVYSPAPNPYVFVNDPRTYGVMASAKL